MGFCFCYFMITSALPYSFLTFYFLHSALTLSIIPLFSDLGVLALLPCLTQQISFIFLRSSHVQHREIISKISPSMLLMSAHIDHLAKDFGLKFYELFLKILMLFCSPLTRNRHELLLSNNQQLRYGHLQRAQYFYKDFLKNIQLLPKSFQHLDTSSLNLGKLKIYLDDYLHKQF